MAHLGAWEYYIRKPWGPAEHRQQQRNVRAMPMEYLLQMLAALNPIQDNMPADMVTSFRMMQAELRWRRQGEDTPFR